jgi:hypothetical protein
MRHFNLAILTATFLAAFVFSKHHQAGKEKALTEKTHEPLIKKQEADSSAPANLNFLKKLNGKYPYNVKLLDNVQLKTRLKKLLGTRFTFLKKTWAVETPIEIKNNIFVAKGCETHNCSSTNFIIVVNFTKNILYAGIREEDNVKTYSEDGSIPEPLNEWAKGN